MSSRRVTACSGAGGSPGLTSRSEPRVAEEQTAGDTRAGLVGIPAGRPGLGLGLA